MVAPFAPVPALAALLFRVALPLSDDKRLGIVYGNCNVGRRRAGQPSQLRRAVQVVGGRALRRLDAPAGKQEATAGAKGCGIVEQGTALLIFFARHPRIAPLPG